MIFSLNILRISFQVKENQKQISYYNFQCFICRITVYNVTHGTPTGTQNTDYILVCEMDNYKSNHYMNTFSDTTFKFKIQSTSTTRTKNKIYSTGNDIN